MILVAVSSLHLCFIQSSMHVHCNDAVCNLPYRYWPNNKSRMYVLENTGEYLYFHTFSSLLLLLTSALTFSVPLLNIPGDYVRTHNLRVGDFIMIYRDDDKNRFVLHLSSWLFKHITHFCMQLVVT